MFKAGDRVKHKRGTTFSNGAFVNTVDKIAEGGLVWLLETGTWVGVEAIEHETPTASPVRTVTRREIVPGAYGQVSVISADRGRVEIFIDATSTSDQLREAAHLFNQLAEALEDKP